MLLAIACHVRLHLHLFDIFLLHATAQDEPRVLTLRKDFKPNKLSKMASKY